MKVIDPKDRLIVALDVNEYSKAMSLADDLAGKVGALKVGFELFTAAGPGFVMELIDKGHKVFLDMKFHDIPNTVGKAILAASSLGVFMVNVHVMGGVKMMQAAALAGQQAGGSRPLIIGVTVLTSMGEKDLSTLGIPGKPLDVALHYAKLAKDCGLDGVVASAHEAKMIKQFCGDDFVVVTPGIRPVGSDAADQKRIMTPTQAVANGSDYLVVGRPIHGAEDPGKAAEEIVAQIASKI